jgi:ABC-2 type transport system ATP-binding protein
VISVRGLRKRFGVVQAVAGVDLAVESGEVLLLLGQNGAGKSTTLRCLGGILRPDEGEIELDDLRLPHDLDSIRTQLGVVPDLARLYGRNTAWEYLEHFGALYGVPAAERHSRIAALLERFELSDAADRVLSSYSRGMAQKVALIRATLHRPRWLFCDEPTVGLDPVAAADMRRYLGEQRDRGAAVIVTTHVLVEAELLADRVAIMRRGRVVAGGTLASLRRWAHPTRRFTAVLSADLGDPKAILDWLRDQGAVPELEGRRLTYGVPWEWPDAELAEFAAELQRRLLRSHAPYFELSEQQQSLEQVYLKAMAEATDVPPVASRPATIPGLRAARLLGSLRDQPRRLVQFLPFYVSSWWRRGDLSWVMYLNTFVLLLLGGVSLFGSAPGNLGSLTGRMPRGAGLEAGLLLPLFFMSFALLESIKSSIGIWWEKAQQSLEVLLYTPLDDPSLIWLEVLPGVVVSAFYVTFWVAAGMTLLTALGRPAPWDLLPVFGFVAVATAYWAAMGRLLGFMLFPREGAAGGAWSFLLSPISAAVADLPLALFVFRSPFALASLLLPLGACLALTIVTGATFDRERLLETGVGRERAPRRRWLPVDQLRRHLPALALGALLAVLPAVAGAAVASSAGVHSWPSVIALFQGHHGLEPVVAAVPAHVSPSGVAIAAAAMAGVVSGFALLLLLLAVTFAAFFLLGLPELLLLPAAAALWGAEIGFGPYAPLQGWLGLAGGIVVLALTINTAAGLPLYSALAFGAGSRIERLRAAWADYFALYRGLVIPVCAVFGIVVIALLITNT